MKLSLIKIVLAINSEKSIDWLDRMWFAGPKIKGD
jgi:hypothetical protein